MTLLHHIPQQLMELTPLVPSVSHCVRTCTQVVMTVVLLYTSGIDNLAEIKRTLKDINDWQSLGLELGLLYPTLKRIEEEQHRVVDKCKTEMLAAWLQQQDNVAERGVPCLAVLKKALRNIAENKLASEINL